MKPAAAVVTVTLNPAIDQTLTIPGFAAGRVNRVAESRSHAGGKGVNVALSLAGLLAASEHEIVATGFLGAANAEIFAAAFSARGITDRLVRIDGATRTGLKIVDPSTDETTDINFPGLALPHEAVEQLLACIGSLAAPGRWFVLSGSLPPGPPDDFYAVLLDTIHAKGGHALLDTSGRPLRAALAGRPEVMKPNREELGELTGQTLETTADVRAAAAALLQDGVQRVIISMGGDGAVFAERGQALLARPPRVAVRSTVGAGDAMVAGLVAGLLLDRPLAELARTATACGALAVTQVGSGITDLAALRALESKVNVEPLD